MGSVVSSDKLFVCGRESLICAQNDVPSVETPTVKQEVEIPLVREADIPLVREFRSVPMDMVGFPFPPYANSFAAPPCQLEDVIPYPPSPLHRGMSDQEYDMLERELERRYAVDPSICPGFRRPNYLHRGMSDQVMSDQAMLDCECKRGFAPHSSTDCPFYKPLHLHPVPNGVCKTVPLQDNKTMNEPPFICSSDTTSVAKFSKKKRSRKQRRHNNKTNHEFLDPVTDPRVEQQITDEYDRESFKSFMSGFRVNCDNAQSYNQIYESVLSKYKPKEEEIVIREPSKTMSKEELDEQLDQYMADHPIFQKPE